MPVPMVEIVAGLDDTATMTQQCEGWSYFVLRSSGAVAFEAEAKELLPNGVTEFHGKKWKPAQSNEYRTFLELIRRSLEADDLSHAGSSLNSVGWKGDFEPFCEELVRSGCNGLGISDDRFIDITTRLFPSLVTFQRVCRGLNAGAGVRFTIDTDDMIKAFPELEAIVSDRTIQAELVLQKMYNIYRTRRFPSAPELLPNGISIVRGSKSFMVQAADVIGNFSLAYVYDKGGAASPRVAQKAQLFRDVFADIIDDTILSEACEFIDGELRLKQEGAFNFAIA